MKAETVSSARVFYVDGAYHKGCPVSKVLRPPDACRDG